MKYRKIILFSFFITLSIIGFSQEISSLQQRKLFQTLTAISTMYVDTINDKKMVENTIKSVLEELDPHSTYTPKEEVQRMHEPLEGSFDGIGVQFQMIKDTMNVVQTITGTPAERVGVLPGDKIIQINDSVVAGVKIQNSDILKKLRGKRGTPVWVKIMRNNNPELIEFKIIRDKIPIFSIDATYMLTNQIGFIKINNFGSTTADEFRTALQKLKDAGMKDLVLSLERNGGGYLHTAIDLVDEFFSADKLIVYTEGKNTKRTEAKSTKKGGFQSGRIVVLVDEYSASASEILSGAIQDWDRGVIVGRRTFGKGLVQREIPLIDGSIIRLTMARYYTPTGRSIQKPYDKGVKDYQQDLISRYKHGEFLHKDSINFPDSLMYKTLVNKRTVYGGGGIMPDVFVPVDTTENTKYHQNLNAKGVINATIMQFMNENRYFLKQKYPGFEQFNAHFDVSDELLKQLVANGEKEKVEFKEDEFNLSKRIIKLQMKAIIANNLWEINEFYRVIGKENNLLQKAIEILTVKGEYNRILKNN